MICVKVPTEPPRGTVLFSLYIHRENPNTVYTYNSSSTGRVADPYCFNADPDTDPDLAFFLIADPDPGFDDQKLKKIYSWKFNFYFLDQKLQFTFP
jgi:hypothetical protein